MISPTLDAFLRSWPFDPWLLASLLVSAFVYARGWYLLRRGDPRRWGWGRLAAFQSGLGLIYLALASPIEEFASLVLQAHMAQHLLLMMFAPPLVWLGSPLFPLVRGLPKAVRDVWVAPCLRWRWTRNTFAWLAQPWIAWPLYVGATWLWHTPLCYELALSRGDWHVVEHATFLATSLLFWYPVVRPYPSRPQWSLWLLPPYLLLADLQNTVLAAWLTFSDHVLYPHYTQVPRLGGLTALDDQAAAGVIMWVPGSVAFLLPLFWIALRLLFGSPSDPRRVRSGIEPRVRPVAVGGRTALSGGMGSPGGMAPLGIDLLRLPLVGTLPRRRWFRPAAQLLVAILAGAVILDGLFGSQIAPMNLAGVVPWIHWRGLVIFGLLVAGNVFCFACPFTLPRALARRWLPRGRTWPRALGGKWLAAALLVVFFWSYETFSLWDNPCLTAWIALGYFAAAFVVDGYFRDAAFCKYLCPIGQFNFVQSLVSPWEVKTRSTDVCGACRTKECIRGTSRSPGCEMQLFQPRKIGNFDCTFCMACVQACPHENIGVLAVVPARTLWSDPFRSGIGRFGARPDIAALALSLVFGAFANAAGMVGPVVEQQERLGVWLGDPPRWLLMALFHLITMVLGPLVLVSAAAALGRAWGKLSEGRLRLATRFSFALVPLGFAMWLAHYSFHFLTSWEAIVSATQRACLDLGSPVLGQPLWRCACCQPAAEWIPRFEVLALDIGWLLSLYTGLRVAEAQTPSAARNVRAFAPWAALMTLLFAVGVWIVYQPMQMRGMLPPAG